LVVAQESKRLAGQSNQGPVVAIYPKEGTFWSDHPYIILNAPWVTDDQREAAEDFQAFLLDRPQQLRAIELGFRPSDVSIPLAAPLDADHGVDPAQPQTVLEAPTADVLAAVLDLWRQVKKPVDLIVLIDVSGSMQGEKIAAARASLLEFVEQLDDRDRLEVLVFSDDVLILTPLTELGPKRDDVLRRISGIIEGGNTRLYDATLTALDALQLNGDPDHIRAVVVLSDGMDTQSTSTLDDVLTSIGQVSEEGGTSIKLFTIAFGNDADKNVLRQMAETTGGKLYTGDPKTIRQIYAEIATFF
jgi:Ca-activated chloride channel family protein